MAQYIKKLVEPYPETGFIDKPSKLTSISAAILNNWVTVFKSVEQWLYDHDILSIEPNSSTSGVETEELESIAIDDTVYTLAPSMNNIKDVVITSPSNKQFLVYDTTTSKWINDDRIVILTSDEYDDLPSSKTSDGRCYFITDWSPS